MNLSFKDWYAELLRLAKEERLLATTLGFTQLHWRKFWDEGNSPEYALNYQLK